MRRQQLYVVMYRALDSIYDRLEAPPEELILFLSDANPYIWDDRTAADPALQSDFDASMDEQNIGAEVEAATAYRTVKNFLAAQYLHYAALVAEPSRSFDELFEEITPDDWIKIYADVADEES